MPILKKTLKDTCDEDNYMHRTMATVDAKILAKLALKGLENYMDMTGMQFGLKTGLSTDVRIFALSQL